MAEMLALTIDADRAQRYPELTPQIEALIEGEDDMIANLANIAAALKEAFNFFWIGFYLVRGTQLTLGPFQGPIACTRIGRGQGVCGRAWERRETLIVPDVDKFPGHIACSTGSRSEIVVPMFGASGEVVAVLDVDSDKLEDFNEIDAEGLGRIAAIAAVVVSRGRSDE